MAVYQEVEPHVIALMQDVFGNYVIQKCLEHGTKVRRLSFPLRQVSFQAQAVATSMQRFLYRLMRLCLLLGWCVSLATLHA